MRIRISKTRGSILVICLALGILLSAVLVGYLDLVGSLNTLSTRSQSWNTAIAVAEAGIEEALTQINYTNYLASSGWNLVNGLYVKTRPFGDGYYAVAISNAASPTLFSTGYVSTIKGGYVARQVRVTTARNGLFSKGLVAKGTIRLSGGVRTDSFNSTDPNFSTNGRYDPNKFKDNGDVATDSQVVSAITENGGVTIYGHVSTGPNGTITMIGSSVVGSLAFIQSGGVGIQAGWSSDDMNVLFPDVQAPFSGGAFAPASGIYNGQRYTYVLGQGNYQMSELNLGGQQAMVVTNNAVLYVTDDISLSGQSYILIAPGASLQLYCSGSSASLTGNGVVNPNANATNFCYYGLPSNQSLSLSGNAAFTGVIYAPEANLSLNGGGNNTYDLVGSAVVNSATIVGHFNFHYDENLGNMGPNLGYLVTSWNEF